MSLAVGLVTALSLFMLALTLWNAWLLLRLSNTPRRVSEPVSILVPARNEERALRRVVESLLAQRGLDDFEVVVLDDGSTDSTPEILRELAAPRLRVVDGGGGALPAGWLGKPWACHRLSMQARGSVLVFVDADVVLQPHAVAAAVTLLRESELQLVSPFPRQLTGSALEWLVQPWLTWLWLATMPLWWAARSHRPELSAANGQFLVLDSSAYRAVGGHEAVRSEVIDDINLMRAIRAAGFHALPADGSAVAACRMYEGPRELAAGYSKSLWQAFGGPAGSVAANALLLAASVGPWLALLNPAYRVLAALGVAASVGSRLAAAAVTRSDPRSALAQPAAAIAFLWLNITSWFRHSRGANEWKGRNV